MISKKGSSGGSVESLLKKDGHGCLFWSYQLQKEGKLMSTSLLYHGWGLRGYEYRASGFQHGEVCFRVEQKPDTFRCSNCGSAHVQTCGQVSRRLRSLPI